jgi:hypothetical protein
LDVVEEAISRTKSVLVVIDPIPAYLGAEINSFKDQDIRRGALKPLNTLAENTRTGFLGLRHLTKNDNTKAIYRGSGSVGIIAAARSGMLIAPDPDDESRRILATTKSNLAAKPLSLAFRIVEKRIPGLKEGIASISWEGTSEKSADEILAAQNTKQNGTAKLEQAKDFLEEFLCCGPRLSDHCYTEAADRGISSRTLERAKRELGIPSTKELGTSRWLWSLPQREEVRSK